VHPFDDHAILVELIGAGQNGAGQNGASHQGDAQ